jgi:hypothetical protein
MSKNMVCLMIATDEPQKAKPAFRTQHRGTLRPITCKISSSTALCSIVLD